jgi:Ca2+-binding RTX toxin-like protein
VLTGGDGVDTFVYNADVGFSSDSNDLVKDTITDLEINDFIYLNLNNVNDFKVLENIFGSNRGGSDNYYRAMTNGNNDQGSAVGAINISTASLANDFVARGITILNAVGTAVSDTIAGGANNDTIDGGNGNDIITGGAGADSLTGGDGDDTFLYANAAELLTGGALIDSTISGGNGTDRISVVGGLTVVANVSWAKASSIEELFVTGTAASNIVLGQSAQTAGIETINISESETDGNVVDVSAYNGVGRTTIVGSATHTNILVGESGFNTITGGAADDMITGGARADRLIGGDGNDTITGGAGADIINAGAGVNVVTDAGDGADVITHDATTSTTAIAVTGIDTVSLTASQAGATATVAGTVAGVVNASTSTAAVTLTSTSSGNVMFTGGTLADTITGGSGNDTITGGTGADTLTGGTGADTFNIDSGTDTITDLGLNNEADVVVISASASVAATTAGNWTATAATQNNSALANGVINVSNDDDVSVASVTGSFGWTIDAAGNAAASTLIGSTMADSITGSNGNDVILGGEGNDTIRGGEGNDAILGNKGDDLIFGDDGNDYINGGQGNDTIWGGDGDDYVLGGTTGDDVLYGENGNDTLVGGAGADTLTGGAGVDTFIYNAVVGTSSDSSRFIQDTITDLELTDFIYLNLSNVNDFDVTVDVQFGSYYFADTNGDRFSSVGDVLIYVGEAPGWNTNLEAQQMTVINAAGTTGNDSITGGINNDTITGGAGADTLTGGDGADVFVYVAGVDATGAAVATANGSDSITDFSFVDDALGVFALLESAEAFVVQESGFSQAASNVVVITDLQVRFPGGGALTKFEVDSLGTQNSSLNEAGVIMFSNNGTVELWYDSNMGGDWAGANTILIGTFDNLVTADLLNAAAANFV